MEKGFEEVKKKLGFGCMRLPMNGEAIDHAAFSEMVDVFLENGFNYFDTAHGYHGGLSELALKECLTSRHPRESYLLTNKLSNGYFRSEKGIRPFFEDQLRWCGVDYFDFYLMHAQNRLFYIKYKGCNAYETAFKLKEEGKIRHVGISFHDRAAVLDKILTEYPDIEAVQIQLNYVDYYSSLIQGQKCYEVCRKHNKPIIVMEPVKGGTLARLPDAAQGILERQGSGSAASYAIRYAAGFDGVFMVLSGMSNLAQVKDNIAFMRDFQPLSDAERAAVERVSGIYRGLDVIPCTACRYCTEGCPKKIPIPDLFTRMNNRALFKDGEVEATVSGAQNGRASDCVRCGKCEGICPQGLEIRKLLKKAAKQFD